MEDFKPINTQEELDAVIGERLKRERKTISDQFSDYAALKKKADKYDSDIAALKQTIAERDSKIKGYETSSVKMRIAREEGIPFELMDRLTGETEDDIRNDAKAFSQLIGNMNNEEPLATETSTGADAGDASYRSLLAGLTKGE